MDLQEDFFPIEISSIYFDMEIILRGNGVLEGRDESSPRSPLQPGVLDEQFLQLQQLQDERSSPNFVYEVTSVYFSESEKILKNLRLLLMEKELSDYRNIEIHVNQFMGSSSSIGANRIKNICIEFRMASEQNNRAVCLRSLELLENYYYYLKNKLHEFFHIQQQRSLAARARYHMQN